MISQIIIAVMGVTAVWLSQDSRIDRQKYASIFGLLGQPAWFYAAWSSEQWGIFVLCFLYTFCWLRGFKRHWLDKKVDEPINPFSKRAFVCSKHDSGHGELTVGFENSDDCFAAHSYVAKIKK